MEFYQLQWLAERCFQLANLLNIEVGGVVTFCAPFGNSPDCMNVSLLPPLKAVAIM